LKYGLRADTNESTEKMYATTRKIGFNDVVRNRIIAGNFFLLNQYYNKYYTQALKIRRLISNDFYNTWEKVHILLTPTTLSTAPLYSEFTKHTNRHQCATQDFCTQPANMAGVPAISIPIKLSSYGMPLSLQLIAPNFEEKKLLSLARYIEHIVQFKNTKK